MDEERVKGVLDGVQRNIEDPEHGFHIISVGVTVNDPEDSGPPFAYTIGLAESFGHPEVLCLGGRGGAYIVGRIGQKVREGRTFEPGGVYHGVLETEFAISFVAVSIEVAYLGPFPAGVAHRYYHDRGIALPPYLQAVFPDKENRFPWEDDYDAKGFGWQVVLGDVPAVEVGDA